MHSFVHCVGLFHFFIFVRGEVHCGRFSRDNSVTKVHQQVVVVAVIGGLLPEVHHIFFYLFFAYKF